MSVGLDGRIGWMEMDVDRLGVQSTLALLPRCLGSQCTMRKIRNTCEIHPFFPLTNICFLLLFTKTNSLTEIYRLFFYIVNYVWGSVKTPESFNSI